MELVSTQNWPMDVCLIGNSVSLAVFGREKKKTSKQRITNMMQPLHFSGVNTEAQRGDVICPKPCS